jgi:hypothetical protein
VEDRIWGAGPPRPPAAPQSAPGELLGDDLAARLERWAAEARVEDAARQRTRERWLRQQAEEGASLAGVLCDLAERGTPVAVRTRFGRQHRGSVQAVGNDFVAVATAAASGPVGTTGPVAVVALDAVSSVRPQPASAPPTGDRATRTDLRLAEVLAGLAAERERVLIVALDGEEAITGSLRSVGRDLVVVRLDGPEPGSAYVPIAAITELILDAG